VPTALIETPSLRDRRFLIPRESYLEERQNTNSSESVSSWPRSTQPSRESAVLREVYIPQIPSSPSRRGSGDMGT
jgi:hypothetical protein